MRRSAWSMPTLRRDTNARSFHLDAHTSVRALHAMSQRSSSSGGGIPASTIAAWISSSIPAGAVMRLTQTRHAERDRSSAVSEESSIAATRDARSVLTPALIASSRMCSMVPNGMTMDLGRLIQDGITPPPRLSLSARVLIALAPTTPFLNSSRGTVNAPQNGILASLSPLGTLETEPPAPVPTATAEASTMSHTTSSPPATEADTASPSSSARPFRTSSS
mmetsp:Transcript_9942/g.45414  ORF Transcript_9942/g.45414 Transcript_9942/m.45414 type:complete len:221 (-) Transcript_9942:1129-1791(-)